MPSKKSFGDPKGGRRQQHTARGEKRRAQSEAAPAARFAKSRKPAARPAGADKPAYAQGGPRRKADNSAAPTVQPRGPRPSRPAPRKPRAAFPDQQPRFTASLLDEWEAQPLQPHSAPAAQNPAGDDAAPALLEGRNAVREALKSGRSIDRLLVNKEAKEGSIREILGMARDRRIVIQEVTRDKLDAVSQTGAHQGVIAYIPAFDYVDVDEMLAAAKEKGQDPLLVILDGLSDPHNLGAVLRTAESCGAHGVIIPKRRAVGLTPAAAKASAGAVEYVPVARVPNIASCIRLLKEQGVWIACAEVGGTPYDEANLKGPLALVIGSEGEGVSRLVQEQCDFTVSLPMLGKMTSLNASVAAAVLLYEAVRQRKAVPAP